MTFRVGQKVACVDASPCRVWGELGLIQNAAYTIEAVTDGLFWRRGAVARGVLLRLVEIKSPHKSGTFGHLRFRPIVERKTDISIFKRMLKPQGVDA